MKKYLSFLFVLFLSFLFIFNVSALEFPSISSNNVLFINMDNSDIIYEKRANDKALIASLTKIMTAIITIENVENMDEKIVITSDMISGIGNDYVKVGFKAGDVVTYRDIVNGILLKSGADATNIAAISTSQSIDNFVGKMNEKAYLLKMYNTHFTNTIGMDNDNHYSTAKDLSILLKYAYNNKEFRKIFESESYITTDTKHNINGPLKIMHNDIFKMDYAKGAKTGYTKAAGLCLASISKNQNNNFMLITLGNNSQDKNEYFMDSKKIYDYYFNNYKYKKILKKEQTILNLKTQYDENIIIKTNTKEDVIKYLNKSITKEDLIYDFDGKQILNKQIKKGDYIGTYFIKYNDEVLYKEKIYSPKTVFITFDYFLKHDWYILLLIGLVLILFMFFIHKIKKNSKNKHR